MILITGASGFIGKKLAVLVRKKYRNEKVIAIGKKDCNLVSGKGIKIIPENPRIIFHLAAATDTANSDQRTNNIGTKNLLEVLNIGPESHLIYTSSQAIFSGRLNTNSPIGPKTKPKTNNKYGKTKLEAERILINEAKKKKFKLTIIRLPTVWGDNPRKNSFLNFLKGLVKSNSPISRLNYPGKIGLVYVDDAAKYILGMVRKRPQIVSIATENLTLTQIFKRLYESQGEKYTQLNLPNFIWIFAKILRPYLNFFEFVLPANVYNYFWRASIVVDGPLWCKVNLRGTKFTS